jgi:hypothetical protein
MSESESKKTVGVYDRPESPPRRGMNSMLLLVLVIIFALILAGVFLF